MNKDEFNLSSKTIIAMAITSNKPKAEFPFSLSLEEIRLPKPSLLKISQVRTLDVNRLGEVIATCPKYLINKAIMGLTQILS